MQEQPTNKPQVPRPHGATNPLGGRIHSDSSHGARARSWSGFVERVRRCPICEWENDSHSRYCVNCAEPIDTVGLTGASDPNYGARAIQRRMAMDRRHHQRHRPEIINGSGGWIAVGGLLLIVALFLDYAPMVQALLWLAAIISVVIGIWQIRYDEASMRRWGAIIAALIVGLVGFVGVRALSEGTGTNLPAIPGTPLSTPFINAPTAAGVEASGISGMVPMAGGDATHSGVMPGPAPASSPNLAWRTDTTDEVIGAPVLADGRLYATTKGGSLVALDAATGTLLWQQQVTTYVLRASPAVANGLVLIGGGFTFRAFDAVTGEPRWEVPLQYGGQASPMVHEGKVFVGSQQGWMYGLDAQRGTSLWRVPTEGIVFGSVALDGSSLVYGTDEGILYNVSPDTGRVTWRAKVDGAIFASPVIADGLVYIPTQAGNTAAFDLVSGELRWTADFGSAHAMAVANGVVVQAGTDGGIRGLDSQTGTLLWLYPTTTRVSTAPSIAGNMVLVGSGESLLGIDLATGVGNWYYLASDVIASPAIAADGHVWFGSQDGFLIAITAQAPAAP